MGASPRTSSLIAALEARVGLIGRQQRADRQPAGEPLRDRDRVGPDTGELGAEPEPAAADARLHLVVDQQCPVAIAQLARKPQPGVVDRPHAALALDRLDEDGAGLGPDRGARALRSLRGRARTGRHGLERLALCGRPAGREGCQRAAVKGALDAHHAMLGRAPARAPGRAGRA